MTRFQFVVILSEAKDLYVSLANSIKENTYESLLLIPLLSVMSLYLSFPHRYSIALLYPSKPSPMK